MIVPASAPAEPEPRPWYLNRVVKAAALGGVAALGVLSALLWPRSPAAPVAAPVEQVAQLSAAPSVSPPPAKQEAAVEQAAELARLREEVAALKSARPAVEPAPVAAPSAPVAPPPVETPVPTSTPGSASVAYKSVADLIEAVKPSVVRIDVEGRGMGTGFMIDELGTVVTNFHVIDGARKAQATFASKEVLPILGFLAVSPAHDVAVLRLDVDKPLKPLNLAPNLPRHGEAVVAIGCPEGFEFTVSEGLVSAHRRGREIDDVTLAKHGVAWSQVYGKDPESLWVQTTTAVSHGNSGGPLVDMHGNVVGAVTWGYRDGQNLNFAISSLDILAVAARETKVVHPFSELPQRPPEVAAKSPAPVMPAPGANPSAPHASTDDAFVEKTRALRSIYARAAELKGEKQTVDLLRLDVQRTLASVQAELVRINALGRSLIDTVALSQNQIAQLRGDLSATSDPTDRRLIQSNIDALVFDVENNRRQYAALDAQATKLNVSATSLNSELTLHQNKLADLYAQADQLRLEWLGIVRPRDAFDRGEEEKSLAILTEWIVLDTEFSWAYIARAMTYHRLGRFSDAAADLAKAKSLTSPDNPIDVAFYGYGGVYIGQGRTALTELNRAVVAAPASAVVLWLRGAALIAERDYSRALADLKRAAKLRSDATILADLSLVLSASPRESLRHSALALEHANAACKLAGPDDWRPHLAHANALALAGRKSEAQGAVARALQAAGARMPHELRQWGEKLSQGEPFTLAEEETTPARRASK